MTEALQIMYLPFELIGKGLKIFISKLSNRKCYRDHHIHSHFNDTGNLCHLSEKKRKNTQRRHITCCIHRPIILFPVYVHQSRTHVSENARHFFNEPKQSDCNENYLRIYHLQRSDHVVDHERDPFSWR